MTGPHRNPSQDLGRRSFDLGRPKVFPGRVWGDSRRLVRGVVGKPHGGRIYNFVVRRSSEEK